MWKKAMTWQPQTKRLEKFGDTPEYTTFGVYGL